MVGPSLFPSRAARCSAVHPSSSWAHGCSPGDACTVSENRSVWSLFRHSPRNKNAGHCSYEEHTLKHMMFDSRADDCAAGLRVHATFEPERRFTPLGGLTPLDFDAVSTSGSNVACTPRRNPLIGCISLAGSSEGPFPFSGSFRFIPGTAFQILSISPVLASFGYS